MNAKEMFEELGYDVVYFNTGRFTQARKKKRARPLTEWDYGREIWFDQKTKSYKIYGEVSLELHKAIHQQMKELGWIE